MLACHSSVLPGNVDCWQAAAQRVRRGSSDSIGNASDLLHPDSAAQKSGKDDLDEPDFWDKMSQFSVRMRKDGRYFFQVGAADQNPAKIIHQINTPPPR